MVWCIFFPYHGWVIIFTSCNWQPTTQKGFLYDLIPVSLGATGHRCWWSSQQWDLSRTVPAIPSLTLPKFCSTESKIIWCENEENKTFLKILWYLHMQSCCRRGNLTLPLLCQEVSTIWSFYWKWKSYATCLIRI